ncbi:hypothetical protein EVAR_18811_1 [Eumeta japonica]|uniref:Reverse transcriptase domain-containing protein n=1 Tax=Eumeta variegata TaxID=151549 RepID=A0A4C1ULL6_EUMVA|nr:hypothetical protein EVAR_18811_1 [Eumeta japonica]
MKNKKKLKEIYITEDYSKETLEKRKALKPQLIEERKKGNFAYIKYDQLIVKKNTNNKDKRKREISTSPQNDPQPRKQQTLNLSTNKRINAFDMMREKKYPPPSRLVLVGEKDHDPPKKVKNTSDIYKATFNTRSLRTTEKRIKLELAIAEIKWDIIGISEMRIYGEGIEDYGDYILHYKGETPGLITSTLDENQPKEQAGFRSKYSTVDYIHVLRQILQKYNEYNRKYYLGFVDYNKAFDSLEHDYIWEALRSQGVQEKYMRLGSKIDLKAVIDNSCRHTLHCAVALDFFGTSKWSDNGQAASLVEATTAGKETSSRGDRAPAGRGAATRLKAVGTVSENSGGPLPLYLPTFSSSIHYISIGPLPFHQLTSFSMKCSTSIQEAGTAFVTLLGL